MGERTVVSCRECGGTGRKGESYTEGFPPLEVLVVMQCEGCGGYGRPGQPREITGTISFLSMPAGKERFPMAGKIDKPRCEHHRFSVLDQDGVCLICEGERLAKQDRNRSRHRRGKLQESSTELPEPPEGP